MLMWDKWMEWHFNRWHEAYDDTGRVVSKADYRRIVHSEDHSEDGYTNHRHIGPIVIRRRK